MLAPTHILGGQVAYLAVAWWSGHQPVLAEAVVAMAMALVPDLDCRQSIVGRMVPWLSGWLHNWVGHRTATHSLLAVLLVTLLAWPLPEGYTMAVVAGFASHALLDMMSASGVAWFWPSRARCVLPGNAQWRMEAMGKGELIFATLLAVVSLPVAVAAEREVGLLGTVRDALGDISQARSHYDAHKSEAAWWLHVQGQDNEAFRAVEGRFAVVGAYRADGLIVETPEGARSVCRAEACDWYARRAVIERGPGERTTIRRVNAEGVPAAALREVLAPLERVGTVYLLGEVTGERLHGRGPTVQGRATGATLRYARPRDLAAWGDAELERVELVVQVRHAPGQLVPAIQPLAPRAVEVVQIDQRILRYMPQRQDQGGVR
ncbi:hypothetical protein CKO15_10810 [Halorhodospira abdelmalekii]|uniref:metal-dependent hydrolase n=1 Tax=Halorhodospira abdelmalekii TaxID=421629 RepID=UPI001902DDC1|nr:metal-dependent hydrolase [Halorhodospira abdelmalekii]MBK1735759.1 hypothetical protein [Halorhodospira abdelmalekii]